VHAKVLPWTDYRFIEFGSLVLIASAVFVLECRQRNGQTEKLMNRQTDRQMQLNALSAAGGCTAGVG